MKKMIIFLSLALLVLLVFVFSINRKINKATDNKVYNNVDAIPSNRVGLLLGTSKLLSSGEPNLYFKYRISAALALYRSGKIERLLISGDHSRSDYNEPQDMKDELVKEGVPTENIYLDYAGLRTYDSVFRAKEIFGQRSFTVISQGFHNRRAIYIAQSMDLELVGFNAKNPGVYQGFKVQLRELFARVKVFLDLAINKQPKYLGDAIEIN